MTGPMVCSAGLPWLMSAIDATPPATFVTVLTSTAGPVAVPLASTGVRNNCTVAPASTGLLIASPTLKTGALEGLVVELLASVILSLLLDPVSLAGDRTGAGGAAGGV